MIWVDALYAGCWFVLGVVVGHAVSTPPPPQNRRVPLPDDESDYIPLEGLKDAWADKYEPDKPTEGALISPDRSDKFEQSQKIDDSLLQ